ncbi:MAG: NADP-dependent malic enzyme [bacterium]
MDYGKKSVELHRKKRGKIEIKSKVSLKTINDLALAYTPGVAEVCREIGQDKSQSYQLTNRANQVAIVSDGTAILGLGDLGPEAAMPVMEGKAIIFKEFAGIDAVPLCINSTKVEEIVKFCKMIEPSFAGINLEDIAAPRCFEILAILEKELDIPVFHDDQDGTAIVLLAALINTCRVSGRALKDLKIVVNGAGAAGIAITKLLLHAQVADVVVVDSVGIINKKRAGLNAEKKQLALVTNKSNKSGELSDALMETDVFVGVSKGNILTVEMVQLMNHQPFIFAMANPTPEIMPELAYLGGASIVGTGRSDLPNQVNNALVFPGLFRGILKAKIKIVTPELKFAIAMAIASVIKPTKNKLMPLVMDKRVVLAIEKIIIKYAQK